MKITVDSAADTTVLTLSGELDITSAPLLERAMDELGAIPRRLVIDLAQVRFMDSTGLRALLLARQRTDSAEHELLLGPGPSQVQRIFELSGTLERFSFRDQPAT